MSPGIDDLEAVGVGGNDVEFAAIGLQKHLRGIPGKLEIGDEGGMEEIDDRETRLRAGHDEGEGRVGRDEDFVGLRDDRNRGEKLEGACVVDGEDIGTPVNDNDVFCVGSDASLDGFGIRVGTAIDLSGGCVDGDELVGVGRRGVHAIAIGREIDGEGIVPDGNAGDLVGRGVENEDEVGCSAPDFVAFRVLAEVGDGGADREAADGLKAGEVDGGEGAVCGGDVGVHVEVGTEEGRAMFAQKNDNGGDEEQHEREVNAEVSGMGHGLKEG